MKFVTRIKQFFKDWIFYDKSKFCGIKDKCCTDDNIFFYCSVNDEYFYQCRTCKKLFTVY